MRLASRAQASSIVSELAAARPALYIQKDSPGADKESNWLAAPAGKFILVLRMYWPNESNSSIIDGTWDDTVRQNRV
jgi:Protein of unknown function (DUF1214)